MTEMFLRYERRFAVAALITCAACGGQDMQMAGTYLFTYPSSHVEILVLNRDSTYIQQLFVSSNEYRLNQPLPYSNNGRWSSHGTSLSFDNWVSFCPSRKPHVPVTPPLETSGLDGAYWVPRNGPHPAGVSIFDETGYVFLRVD